MGHVTVWACLWLAIALSAPADAQAIRATLDPNFVLEQIQKRLDIVSNYQCTQITTTERSQETKYIGYDRRGRGCLREIHDDLGATSIIWDGERTIEVHERVRPDGTVVASASIVPGQYFDSRYGDRPTSYLGGFLVSALTNALEEDLEIDIAPTEGGYWRVAVRHKSGGVTVRRLDPQRGYLPVRRDAVFREIEPGIWFPVAVWVRDPTRPTWSPEQSPPRYRFTNVKVNDPDFERLLLPDLPDGSTVADEVRGVRYVVDHQRGLTLAGRRYPTSHASTTPLEASEGVYRLDANQILKRIAPVSPSARGPLLGAGAAGTNQTAEAGAHNTIYVFQWHGAGKPTVSYTGMGFLKLSEVLQYVCRLDIAEYYGPEKLLELRLAGDWIVRREASKGERLRALERIVRDEMDINVAFAKRCVTAQVARATGIFHYHRLPGTRGENEVQLFAEASVDDRGYYTGSGSGTLAQLFTHVTSRTEMRIDDDTLSSDVEVAWSDYSSSQLEPYGISRGLQIRTTSTAGQPGPADGSDLHRRTTHDR